MNRDTPTAAIAYGLRAYGGLDRLVAGGAFPDVTGDLVDAILAEASRFAEAELLPLNRVGDRAGARYDAGKVTTPPGWPEAYRRWREAGWNGLGVPVSWGGQGMPVVVRMAVQEIWNAANPAFALSTLLTSSGIHALDAHAGDDLKRRFLPKLVAGEWTATMDLTEPQAGSDLGRLTTRAERAPEGTFRLFGQKIFITYGDHDLTENIVHLVLARIPGAPAGTSGISMFAVPKMLDDRVPNDLAAAGIEHKLGLHGSPTCTMVFGGLGEGARGWLVGEENRGLACMFTMMNLARLNIGIQAVGVSAAACRQALGYAQVRRQGRAPGVTSGTSPIVEHPDIQRELLQMVTLTEASRALCLACAEAMDMSATSPPADRQRWADRASLLTPVAKAFATDAVVAVSSAAIQVHGGAGYVEATGVAQYLRDSRIFAIYEGTNGIQAIDLVTRRLKLGDGAAVAEVIAEIRHAAAEAEAVQRPGLGSAARQLRAAADDLAAATAHLVRTLADGQSRAALAVATPYLRLFALAFGLALLAKGAGGARGEAAGRAAALARFHAEFLAVDTGPLAATVVRGGGAVDQGAMLLGTGVPPE
ncbi:acyl-CoA dehydrogenase [soil metagenome]